MAKSVHVLIGSHGSQRTTTVASGEIDTFVSGEIEKYCFRIPRLPGVDAVIRQRRRSTWERPS
ncbi:hypothetical protein [Microvirga massiliensis]|uniref:hypothetical protein n=1 Tax=Microvirga massiliensis TaxID=1033741 RepID=UPI000A86E119|nr:hypothetical protein [Microvirga massiliensis]